MKRLFFSLFIVWSVSIMPVISQNLLSPVWDITSSNKGNGNTGKVNLMLSWERQGFSWMNGNAEISTGFILPKEKSQYNLSLAIQCDISAIFINDTRIGGDIPCSFWSNRGKLTVIPVPISALHWGQKNSIRMQVSNLSYTGGIGHNICELSAESKPNKSSIEISFPNTDHRFLDASPSMPITLKVKTSNTATLNFIIRNDYGDTLKNENWPVKEGFSQLLVEINRYNLKPGFYECIAVMNNGFYYHDVEWFALSPEKIECNNPAPHDFDSYWNKALIDLKSVQPDFRLHKVDSLCSPDHDGFVVEMQSIGGITIRGYYFVPKGAGKYPAILHVPGYSYGFTDHSGFKSRKEKVAELALCVRGHGISTDKFNPWSQMTLWAFNACDKQDNVYRSVFLDCVRAVDFLLSRPEIDHNRIGVTGGSQGGGLTIATAALCNDKIKACAFFDPFPCDTRHQLLIRKMVKDELTSYTKYYPGCTYEKILDIQDYVDTKNLASRIKCPVLFTTSLFDDDCPPHMGFAAYNRIKSPKQYKIFPNDSHLAESGQYDYMFTYLVDELNKK